MSRKEEREFARNQLVKKTKRELENSISRSSTKVDSFMALAKEAREKGQTQQYLLAKAGLKGAMATKNRCEAMLLNMQIVEQMKDLNEISANFADSMKIVSQELSSIVGKTNLKVTKRQFMKAMASARTQNERMNLFLEMTCGTLEDASSDTSDIRDDEIDKLIENEIIEDYRKKGMEYKPKSKQVTE